MIDELVCSECEYSGEVYNGDADDGDLLGYVCMGDDRYRRIPESIYLTNERLEDCPKA